MEHCSVGVQASPGVSGLGRRHTPLIIGTRCPDLTIRGILSGEMAVPSPHSHTQNQTVCHGGVVKCGMPVRYYG
jgi:hypothetical protein